MNHWLRLKSEGKQHNTQRHTLLLNIWPKMCERRRGNKRITMQLVYQDTTTHWRVISLYDTIPSPIHKKEQYTNVSDDKYNNDSINSKPINLLLIYSSILYVVYCHVNIEPVCCMHMEVYLGRMIHTTHGNKSYPIRINLPRTIQSNKTSVVPTAVPNEYSSNSVSCKGGPLHEIKSVYCTYLCFHSSDEAQT